MCRGSFCALVHFFQRHKQYHLQTYWNKVLFVSLEKMYEGAKRSPAHKTLTHSIHVWYFTYIWLKLMVNVGNNTRHGRGESVLNSKQACKYLLHGKKTCQHSQANICSIQSVITVYYSNRFEGGIVCVFGKNVRGRKKIPCTQNSNP